MRTAGFSFPTTKRIRWPSKSQPEAIKDRIKKIRALADKLHGKLQDIPPDLEFDIFEEYGVYEELGPIVNISEPKSRRLLKRGPGDPDVLKHNKRDFLNRLRRISTLKYTAPTGDPIRDMSAELAYRLITEHSKVRPTLTDNCPFRNIALCLYRVARETDEKVI